MEKKLALLFSILLFGGFFIFFAYFPGNEKPVKVLAQGSLAGEVRQAQNLYCNMKRTLDTDRLRLCFRGEELACDRASCTWYLPVDMDGEAWEAGVFTEAEGRFKILPLQDYTLLNKAAAIAKGQSIPLLAWDDRAQSCGVVSVVFTGVSVVRVETDADLNIDTVFAGSMVFYDQCGKTNWTVQTGFQAHERGQTTRAFPKKGYRFNLMQATAAGVVNKNPCSVFGMRNSDSWIFYAIYSDSTKTRDKLNTELWNGFGANGMASGVHMGTHMEYAELFVNGEYWGLYGIMEPIDCSQLGMSDQEYLYKRTYGRELLSEMFDLALPEEYLTVLGMEIKGREDFGTVQDWMCFRRFVEICEAEDEIFSEEAAKLFNVDNAVDIWLYLQMIYGEDNIYKNMFFAFKKEPDGYRMYLVPWDTDLSWGNIYTEDAEKLYTVYAGERAEEYLVWPLLDRMIRLNVGNIKSRITSRWKELRQGVLSDAHLEDTLSYCMHQVQDSGAFERDALRWPGSSHEGEYDSLRGFMKKRMLFLDRLIEDMGNMR